MMAFSIIVFGCAGTGQKSLMDNGKPVSISRIKVIVPSSSAKGKLASQKRVRIASLLKQDLRRELKSKTVSAGATLIVSITDFHVAEKGKAMIGIETSYLEGNVKVVSNSGNNLSSFSVIQTASGAMTGPVNMLVRMAVDPKFEVHLSRNFAKKVSRKIGK